MLKTIIIADDSTGANASAILLNKLNFRSLSLIDYDNHMSLNEYDAVAVGTDSRAIDQNEAYQRVYGALVSFGNVTPLVLNKRIDSTLRGNLGAELNAFMDVFPNKKAAVIPAFPDSKRYCLEGIVYVDKKKLEDTDVAKDPKMPIYSSSAKELFEKQTKHSIANIYLDEIRNNQQLENLIKSTYEKFDIVIFDAKTNEDIDRVSQALVKSNVDIICVDPGPFTFYYTQAVISNKTDLLKKYIYLIGSVVDTTYNQLKYINDDSNFKLIYIDPEQLISSHCDEKLINQVKDLVQSANKRYICITTTDVNDRKVLNLGEIAKTKGCNTEQISKMINNNLAKILISILEQDKTVNGVFCSGGDIALGFLNSTQAKGINLIKEVMPLSVYGKIVGGQFDSLPIITKGGMIGNKDAYLTIKEFFEEVNR